MKQFLKKHYKRIIILTCDAMIVPMALLCKLITENMLKTDSTCAWTLLGGQCISCGGTHFVNDLASLRIVDAFFDNQLMFFITLFFIATLIMFNLWWVFDLSFGKKALVRMYSVPTVIIFCSALIIFLVWRNWFAIPTFIRFAVALVKFIVSKIQQL